MFILYAVPIGLIAGALLGGRLEAIAETRIRWWPVAIVAFAVQVLIFGPLDRVVGAAGTPLYLASTIAVVGVVLLNRRIPGLVVVAIGALSNLAAIVANGGLMPADAGALALAGLDPSEGFTNSVVLERPALGPLTDIFALPDGVPFANVFSVGDVLIGIGIAVAIAASMQPERGR